MGGPTVIGQVVVPTAQPRSEPSAPAPSRLPAFALGIGLLVTVAAWPAIPFSESPPPIVERAVSAPLVAAPLPGGGTALWGRAQPLAPSVDRVVGAGSAVLAVAPNETWPVSLLTDHGWRRLIGLPVGVELVPDVAVERPGGFAVVGVTDAGSVMFDFREDGRFAGARTIFDVTAGVVTGFGESVVLFDAGRPVAAVVAHGIDRMATPGVVVDAAADGVSLLVLVDDGSVHLSDDAGATWTLLGENFARLLTADTVVAIGVDATVGMNRFHPDLGLVRLEAAPRGPSVAWGSSIAVHDWSNDSVWLSKADGGWERLPLWSQHGFTGELAGMVDDAHVPTVVGVDADGGLVVWQTSG